MKPFIYYLNQSAQAFDIKEILSPKSTKTRAAKDFTDLLENGHKKDVVKCLYSANEAFYISHVKNAAVLTRINCFRAVLKYLENMDAETVGYQELFDFVYENLENDLITIDPR